MHHGFIDKLYNDWQTYSALVYDYGGIDAQGRIVTLEDPLVGFSGYTVGDVIDLRNLCVRYLDPSDGRGVQPNQIDPQRALVRADSGYLLPDVSSIKAARVAGNIDAPLKIPPSLPTSWIEKNNLKESIVREYETAFRRICYKVNTRYSDVDSNAQSQ